MPELASEFLFELRASWGDVFQVGMTPFGDRRIRNFAGGTFEGPKLRGEILPGGGDWLLLRPDGARSLEVRATLKTDDGHLIYLTALGMFRVSPEIFARIMAGEEVDPAQYYLRTTPLFETASEKYAWLNGTVAVSVGRLTSTAVHQKIYAIL